MAKKTVAALNIRIGADSARLKRDFGKAKGSVSSFAATIAKLGPIAVAAAVALAGIAVAAVSIRKVIVGVRREFEALDKSAKSAKKLNITLGEMEGLALAAGRAGVGEFTTVEKSIQRMTTNVSEAATGIGEAKASLDLLGVSAADLNKLTPAEQFQELADAIGRFTGSANDELRIIEHVFGSRGAGLINLLRQGSDAIRQGEADAHRFGLVVAGIDADNVQEMNDRFGDVAKAIAGVYRQLGVAVSPELKIFAVDLTDAIVRVKDAIIDLRPEIEALTHAWTVAMQPMIDSAVFLAEGMKGIGEAIREFRGIEVEPPHIPTIKFKPEFEGIGRAIVTMTGTMVDELGLAAEALRLSLRTPEEKFREDLAHFRELLDEFGEEKFGETFRRARERAFDELKDALAKTEKAIKPVSTGAVTRRTAAGFAAVRGSERILREMASSARKREKLLKESIELERLSEAHLEKLSSDTGKEKVHRIV
jgi:hypothetical protein